MKVTRRKAPLLDLDADLGALVPTDRRDAARHELSVEIHHLPRGKWSVDDHPANPGHVGILLLDGVISREVLVADTVSTELLGPGDVVRPWSVQAPFALLEHTVRWNALTETRVALLDRRFGAALGHWPEVNAALIDRLNQRAHRLAITQAISQLTGVDRRVLSLFWHLAERWGRVTGDGVVIPLTLSHRMLGQLVGARRPTVSAAVAELGERGELARRDDGSWLLTGDAVDLPSVEAEPDIPIRRRLIARDAGGAPVPHDLTAHKPAAEEAVTAAEAPTTLAPALEVLTARLARLRGESHSRADELTVSLEMARRVHAEALRMSERCVRERSARARRRQSAGPA